MKLIYKRTRCQHMKRKSPALNQVKTRIDEDYLMDVQEGRGTLGSNALL